MLHFSPKIKKNIVAFGNCTTHTCAQSSYYFDRSEGQLIPEADFADLSADSEAGISWTESTFFTSWAAAPTSLALSISHSPVNLVLTLAGESESGLLPFSRV